MAVTDNDSGYEWLIEKEHKDRKAWIEANGLEEPLGCKNPLDILIQLEDYIDELND